MSFLVIAWKNNTGTWGNFFLLDRIRKFHELRWLSGSSFKEAHGYAGTLEDTSILQGNNLGLTIFVHLRETVNMVFSGRFSLPNVGSQPSQTC